MVGDEHTCAYTDEFIAHVAREKEEAERQIAVERDKRKVKGPLDPLTSTLLSFEDEEAMEGKIADIYKVLDEDEFNHQPGLREKHNEVPVILTCSKLLQHSEAENAKRVNERNQPGLIGRLDQHEQVSENVQVADPDLLHKLHISLHHEFTGALTLQSVGRFDARTQLLPDIGQHSSLQGGEDGDLAASYFLLYLSHVTAVIDQ